MDKMEFKEAESNMNVLVRRTTRPRTESLLQVMYRQVTACYLAAVRALNLDRVKVVHLCQLRRGGA